MSEDFKKVRDEAALDHAMEPELAPTFRRSFSLGADFGRNYTLNEDPVVLAMAKALEEINKDQWILLRKDLDKIKEIANGALNRYLKAVGKDEAQQKVPGRDRHRIVHLRPVETP